MQWLLYGPMTEAISQALVRRGDQVHPAGDLGLEDGAPLLEVLKAADKKQWDIMTTDGHLVQAPFDSGFWFGRSMVFLQLEGGDVEQDDAIDRLFKRYRRLTPGRLYTVTGARVKVRQLPGKAPR